MNRPKQFVAIIGEHRIPVSAKVIETFLRVQGAVPWPYEPAPGHAVDLEQDEPTGADWSQK